MPLNRGSMLLFLLLLQTHRIWLNSHMSFLFLLHSEKIIMAASILLYLTLLVLNLVLKGSTCSQRPIGYILKLITKYFPYYFDN